MLDILYHWFSLIRGFFATTKMSHTINEPPKESIETSLKNKFHPQKKNQVICDCCCCNEAAINANEEEEGMKYKLFE